MQLFKRWRHTTYMNIKIPKSSKLVRIGDYQLRERNHEYFGIKAKVIDEDDGGMTILTLGHMLAYSPTMIRRDDKQYYIEQRLEHDAIQSGLDELIRRRESLLHSRIDDEQDLARLIDMNLPEVAKASKSIALGMIYVRCALNLTTPYRQHVENVDGNSNNVSALVMMSKHVDRGAFLLESLIVEDSPNEVPLRALAKRSNEIAHSYRTLARSTHNLIESEKRLARLLFGDDFRYDGPQTPLDF